MTRVSRENEIENLRKRNRDEGKNDDACGDDTLCRCYFVGIMNADECAFSIPLSNAMPFCMLCISFANIQCKLSDILNTHMSNDVDVVDFHLFTIS